jgi:hypothetical protein
MLRIRLHDAVIRAYDNAGNVIETHQHAGDFKEWWFFPRTERLFLGNFRRGCKRTKKADDISRRAMKWYGNTFEITATATE